MPRDRLEIMRDENPPRIGRERQHVRIGYSVKLRRLRTMEIDPRLAANNSAHDRFSEIVVRLEPNLH
jgi:hypothetical protein